jgi:hypothetical protein
MGNNFLLERARQHRKAWKSEFEAAGRDMHAALNGPLGLKAVAKLHAGNALAAGEAVLIVRRDEAVVVCRENVEVAEVKLPQTHLIDLLEQSCGVVPAEVEELLAKSRAVSIRVLPIAPR